MQPFLTTTSRAQSRLAPVVFVALLLVSDLLIWQVSTPRLAWAVFALTLTAAAQMLVGHSPGRRAVLMGWGGMALGVLPVMEELQTLSVLFLFAAMIHAAGWFVAGSTAPRAVAIRAGLRLFGQAFIRIALDLFSFGRATAQVRPSGVGLLRDWALPLGLGGLFVLLFLSANPLLDRWLQALENWSPRLDFDPVHVGFWLVMACLIWSFLRLDAMRPKLLAPAKPLIAVSLPKALINPGSVLRALVTFNVIFALQTGLDLTYLWGGADLPDGMSYATYAHRGAYPLVLTALLAGGFALIAQPFVAGRPLLRGLLFIWTLQNVLLVLSSILRLDLYIDAYGLTRLRFAALIWMGLVVAGLVLMVWQVWRRKTVRWLFARAGLLGLATLYICCFINVAGLIASHNLARPDYSFDNYYLCTLGPGAVPAITRAELATGQDLCDTDYGLFVKSPQDLREWGYRNYRLRNSLAALAALTEVRTVP